eukprot:gb/GECG01015887.1/.p1 GENE.gb/GECG01015887.1/~~gb/GECG01015887.1/.p1  ORF type:complete len:270 (+),score=28.56 gb/GECG01015887.1/:1-810(+)
MNVLIIGGSKGIGRTLAQQCLQLGHRVAVTSRSASKAQQVAEELGSEHQNATIRGLECDVSHPESIKSVFEAHKSDFPQLDAFVHCAGEATNGLLLRSSDETIEHSLRVNLHGSIYSTRHAVQRMIRQKSGGSIVCVGSAAGSLGNRGQSVYSASKSGLSGFVKSVAAEVATRKVRVNLVEPGLVETEMLSQSLQGHYNEEELQHLQDKMTEQIALKRAAKAHEVSDAICWLAGLYAYTVDGQHRHNSASFVTGTVLKVNGGVGMGLGS